MSRTGLWYAHNELVTGANLLTNVHITGGPHIVIILIELEILWIFLWYNRLHPASSSSWGPHQEMAILVNPKKVMSVTLR